MALSNLVTPGLLKLEERLRSELNDTLDKRKFYGCRSRGSIGYNWGTRIPDFSTLLHLFVDVGIKLNVFRMKKVIGLGNINS